MLPSFNTLKTTIEKALGRYQPPYLQSDLCSAKLIKNLRLEQDVITLDLQFGYPVDSFKDQLIAELTALLKDYIGYNQLQIHVGCHIEPHAVQPGVASVSRVKNIIAVASGKGGVGKSTTTVNVAAALAQAGARVGILDADIYGPNQPQMLGATQRPEITDKKHFIPLLRYGVQSMSIGYLLDANQPTIWRGPMVSRALQQLLFDTEWDNLDYLIVDLPPGTGDIQLTLAQKIPVAGAVIVTTPQTVALLDARKALEMFRKVHVTVLGIVENMSLHTCSHCGHEEAIFGSGGAAQLGRQCGVEVLGALPLAATIQTDTDQGCPTVIASPDSSIAQRYRDIALRLAAKLSLQPKNFAVKFPKIVVEPKGNNR